MSSKMPVPARDADGTERKAVISTSGKAKPEDVPAGNNGTSASAQAELERTAFRAWIASKGTNTHRAARAAGVSVSAIYNFLNGDTASLSVKVLRKLAATHGSTVENILGGAQVAASRPPVKISYRVGPQGSLSPCDEPVCVLAADSWSGRSHISAALVDGDDLGIIPDGWMVFFKEDVSDPRQLIGRLASVRYAGGGPRPVIRRILKSSHPGLHTLQAFDGTFTEDVEILAAHEIVSMAQAKSGKA